MAQTKKLVNASPAAILVHGDDPSLVGQAVRDVVAELVADQDPGMVVEDTELTSDTADVGAIVDALSTPPFLTDRRVVVVRERAGSRRQRPVESSPRWLTRCRVSCWWSQLVVGR